MFFLPCNILFVFRLWNFFSIVGDFDAAFWKFTGHLLPLLACAQAVVGLHENSW